MSIRTVHVVSAGVLILGTLSALHFQQRDANPPSHGGPGERPAAPALFHLEINPESRVSVSPPSSRIVLAPERWEPFRVRVENAAGLTAPLRVTEVQGAGTGRHDGPGLAWRLEKKRLTGTPSEECTLWFRSSRPGDHALTLRFDVGQGTQDLGFRAEADLLFSVPDAAGSTASKPRPEALLWQVRRLRQTLETLGEPLPPEVGKRLEEASRAGDGEAVLARIEAALDPLCLAELDVHPEGRLSASPGAASPVLYEQGWRTFLVKVHNRAGATGSLRVTSPEARPVPNVPAAEGRARWMDLHAVEARPLGPHLSGLALEYRPLQIYSRDAGRRTGTLRFNIGHFAGSGSPLIREWRFPSAAADWRPDQCRIERLAEGIRIHTEVGDPSLSARLSAPGGKMVLRFRARTDRSGVGQVFWLTQRRPQAHPNWTRTFVLEEDGARFREYVVRFTAQDPLEGLQLDIPEGSGSVDLSSLSLSYEDDPSSRGAELTLPFLARPSQPVRFRVQDEQGRPTTAAFVIRDAQGRVYPSQAKRLAPDFFFQAQVYRRDGETLRLPAGAYTVQCRRGPESLPEERKLVVGRSPAELRYRVRRWIDPSTRGWFSGDHHIHAAGCAHYARPTEGVLPEHIARHIQGEDLKVGVNLTWGKCFDYQKQFFTGKTDRHSRYPHLLRYDLEVSGFGSQHSGHLCLLRLKEQMYPGGSSTDHWPTLGLNILRWAKRQGAICGPAHSGLGLLPTQERVAGPDGPNGIPSYAIPAYDGIGANEFIVDVTHRVPGPDGRLVPAVDFLSTMDSYPKLELTMWYHVLNCGFRTRISGETDFPCLSAQRVGAGRVYVKQNGRLTYEDWCEGIREGRSYVSDGFHHLMDFRASAPGVSPQRVPVGIAGSELRLPQPGRVRFQVLAAARAGTGRRSPVELIVNGYPAGRREIPHDGKSRLLQFDLPIRRSSWVAVRLFPGAHTNPIWVQVAGRPLRADRRSAEWCLRGVDRCWGEKEKTYAPAEKEAARQAYEHARAVYRRILREAEPPE